MQPTHTALPHTSAHMFLTDGGIETTLIFHEGLDLPAFAAFVLLDSPGGRKHLRNYYRRYLEIAARHRTGFVLESPTWRSSPDWARQLGYTEEALAAANRAAIGLMRQLRAEFLHRTGPIVISGCVGPRGDGYNPAAIMTAAAAEAYHHAQIATFASAAVDLVTAITMTNVPEAIGIVRVAAGLGLPVVIAFTVETDGALPTGQSLRAAIEEVDAVTGHTPAYYMVNCAHPSHFLAVLEEGAWLDRIGGVRANASCKSHAELNESTTLDAGDPAALSADYAALRARLRRLTVLGGCCGTDHRHIEAMAEQCLALHGAAARNTVAA